MLSASSCPAHLTPGPAKHQHPLPEGAWGLPGCWDPAEGHPASHSHFGAAFGNHARSRKAHGAATRVPGALRASLSAGSKGCWLLTSTGPKRRGKAPQLSGACQLLPTLVPAEAAVEGTHPAGPTAPRTPRALLLCWLSRGDEAWPDGKWHLPSDSNHLPSVPSPPSDGGRTPHYPRRFADRCSGARGYTPLRASAPLPACTLLLLPHSSTGPGRRLRLPQGRGRGQGPNAPRQGTDGRSH